MPRHWPSCRPRASRPPHPRRTWGFAARAGRSRSPTCWRRSRRDSSNWNAPARWRGGESEARASARRKLEEPDPLPGIAPATRERSRLWDPAITVARDIRTPDGALIAAAGTRVNPLERITLARDLLFVDGRREAEIAWALGHEDESGRPAKIVLLAGRPLDLMRRHARPFFFDQGGRLAARLGLRFTPSLVEQAGSRLRITEIPVESLPRAGSGDRDPGSLSGAGPNEADEED